jgi:hypothetical protein
LSVPLPAAPAAAAAPPAHSPQHGHLSPGRIALLFAASLLACLVVYLALAVPGRWFSTVRDEAYGVDRLALSRGSGAVNGDKLVVTHAAEDGTVVVSVTTDLRAVAYPVVAWKVAGLPDDAHVALLWRTDVEPSRLNKRALPTASGRVLALDVHEDPHWLGRITGLALAVQGSLDAPLHVAGVVAKPADAWETLRDRVGEWTAAESWNGASINTVAGGADAQSLPLPLLLACAIVLAIGGSAFVTRRHLRHAAPTIAVCAIGLALGGWFVLDARWLVDLTRHAAATAQRYAGKDSREKHLAADDGPLFAFIDKALPVLSGGKGRVFVVADADFFRGRAAYHLYPHNVWFEPYHDALPPVGQLHAGDWLVVYRRRGVQFVAARRSLRFDDGATVPADLKLLDHGGALFLIR